MSNKFIEELDDTHRDPTDYKAEWVDMPEFKQEDLRSHRAIVVHFRNDEDVEAFTKLMNQVITPKQKAIWYPPLENRKTTHLIYVDE